MIENSFINWHPEKHEGCHKECRVVKPDPKAETGSKYYDNTDEPSDKKRSDKTAAREKTIYGQYYWNYDDESMLEEMWKDEKRIKEIADALSKLLFFSGKQFPQNETNVFVCKNFSCSLPLTKIEDIEGNL